MSLFVLIGLVVILLYLLDRHLLSHWSRLGFKQVEPKFFIGNAGPLLRMKRSMGGILEDLYVKYKSHRFIGIYYLYKPILVINDPKLVQKVFITDFKSFHDRPMPVDEKHDPISAHLFGLDGQAWKDLRIKLTPTFTAGKLKNMFSIINQCGQTLEDYLVKNVAEGNDNFEFRDLMARFATSIISTVAFGIDNDCINEKDNIFRRMGAKFFEPTLKHRIKNVIQFFGGPHLFYKLRLKACDKDVEDFMFSYVKETVECRESNNYTRNDFLQLLIQLKNQGFVKADKGEEEEVKTVKSSVKKFNMDQVTAQAFVSY